MKKNVKKGILSILLFGLAFFGFARAIFPHFKPCSNGETIKIGYDIPDFFEEFEFPEEQQQEVSADRCFKMKFNGMKGECRFLLYADDGVVEKDAKTEARFWDTIILRNIVGEGRHSPMKYYDAETKNFNADMFGMCMIFNPTSEFARGYKFLLFESAFKKGMGICYRVFLTNDNKFFGVTDEGTMNPRADYFKYRGTWRFDTPDFEVERGFDLE